jgi:predicted nucleic-acid-binding protein
MLAVDTNIVVRFLVGDDPAQAAKARKLIDNNDIFVCTTVLLETEWVLRSGYGLSTSKRAEVLAGFVGLPLVALEDPVAASKAIEWMEHGMDFADALHLAKADACKAFVSFDQDLAKKASALGTVKVRAP